MKLYPPKLATSATLALLLAALIPAESHATTLVRMSLDKLADTNSVVVVGEVVDAFSYWNDEGTFILTDVVIERAAQLKGPASKQKRTVLTLMGGEVGDLATVIVGGASLELGKSYVLFASEADLPGAASVLTVRDHSQGVFEVREGPDGGLKAVSQASRGHLVPDEKGRHLAPGGAEGIPLDELLATLADTVDSRQETTR